VPDFGLDVLIKLKAMLDSFFDEVHEEIDRTDSVNKSQTQETVSKPLARKFTVGGSATMKLNQQPVQQPGASTSSPENKTITRVSTTGTVRTTQGNNIPPYSQPSQP
jgi:hypothetical protein